MKTRIISGVFIAVFFIGINWVGGPIMAGALCIVSLIAYLEFTKATRVRLDDNRITGMEVTGILFTIIFYLLEYIGEIYDDLDANLYMLLVMLSIFIFMMIIYVVTYPKYKAYQVMNSYFAFVYVPVMISFIYRTRCISNHLDTPNFTIGFFASFLILIAWVSDTCAYFVGVAIGKHKIFPKLSPKKTFEGCFGGVVGSGLAGYLYGFVLYHNGIIALTSVYFLILLGVVGSVIGQIGDLAASAIKRNFEIKDYGNIIPGHGGIMDRFDSMIMTAPFIYALSIIVFR